MHTVVTKNILFFVVFYWLRVINTTKKLIVGVKNHVRYVDIQSPPPIDKDKDDADSFGMKGLLLLPGAKSDDDIVALLSSRGEVSYYTRKNGIMVSLVCNDYIYTLSTCIG